MVCLKTVESTHFLCAETFIKNNKIRAFFSALFLLQSDDVNSTKCVIKCVKNKAKIS